MNTLIKKGDRVKLLPSNELDLMFSGSDLYPHRNPLGGVTCLVDKVYKNGFSTKTYTSKTTRLPFTYIDFDRTFPDLYARFRTDEFKLIEELKKIGVELDKYAVCRMHKKSVTFGLKSFGESDRHLFKFAPYSEFIININGTPTIKHNSRGYFSPKSTSPYSTAIAVASILKNWDAVCDIIKKRCDRHYFF